MDRFEDLRAFVQTVESGSLTRAAETLQVATSAVSRRIKELEGRLGTQLLQRLLHIRAVEGCYERIVQTRNDLCRHARGPQ